MAEGLIEVCSAFQTRQQGQSEELALEGVVGLTIYEKENEIMENLGVGPWDRTNLGFHSMGTTDRVGHGVINQRSRRQLDRQNRTKRGEAKS